MPIAKSALKRGVISDPCALLLVAICYCRKVPCSCLPACWMNPLLDGAIRRGATEVVYDQPVGWAGFDQYLEPQSDFLEPACY